MKELNEQPDDPGIFPPGTGLREAREYLFHHITTRKLTEKDILEADAACRKWQDRVELARSRGAEDMAAEAEKEAARFRERRDALSSEAAALDERIASLRRQLPGVAARERSVDPDLLEQELRIALGESPGEDPSGAELERGFRDLDAGSALESLKLRMGKVPGADGSGGQP